VARRQDCAASGAQSVASLVFEISPRNPLTFAVVAVVVLGSALIATWLPRARRGSI
jgi:hypothetical protein